MIRIEAIVYHSKRQFPQLMNLINSSPKTEIIVVTSVRNATNIRKMIDDTRKTFDMDWKCIRRKDLSFVHASDEGELITRLDQSFRDAASVNDNETSVLYIDITAARPWESVAVCKLSSAANVCMYTTDEGKRKRILSFPRHLNLEPEELAILTALGSEEYFTTTDVGRVLETIGVNPDKMRVSRLLSSLIMKGCVKTCEQPKNIPRKHNHGGAPFNYYIVVDDSWLMTRIGSRSVEDLDESMNDHIPLYPEM